MTSKDGSIQTLAVDFVNESLNTERRKYRRSKKPRVPHTWRNVPDPFEDVWDEARGWLEMEPERTAKSIFEELRQKYPGKFKDGQLRTMQRRVNAWRSKAILTFDYEWLSGELLAKNQLKLSSRVRLFMRQDDFPEWVSGEYRIFHPPVL